MTTTKKPKKQTGADKQEVFKRLVVEATHPLPEHCVGSYIALLQVEQVRGKRVRKIPVNMMQGTGEDYWAASDVFRWLPTEDLRAILNYPLLSLHAWWQWKLKGVAVGPLDSPVMTAWNFQGSNLYYIEGDGLAPDVEDAFLQTFVQEGPLYSLFYDAPTLEKETSIRRTLTEFWPREYGHQSINIGYAMIGVYAIWCRRLLREGRL